MIRLYTDTSANLPVDLICRHGIRVIPFAYTVNGAETAYSAETPFDGRAFYGAMRAGAAVKTSMINVSRFEETWERDLAAGDEVLYVGMSGGISGTAQAASLAAEELRERYPLRQVAAVDTFAASLGEGLLVLEAAEQIAAGRSVDDIEGRLLLLRRTMCQYFTVDDLEYLRRGGRISGVAAAVGTVLNIKPVLMGDEAGHIVLCGKARGSRRALAALAEKFGELALDRSGRIGIAHADNEEGAERLLGELREAGFAGECLTVCYEPVTGAHVGPGAVALFFPGTQK